MFPNHTNFAPQYDVMTRPLDGLISAETLAAFAPLVISHATVGGKLFSLPRHSDVSNMFYVKSLYEDEAYKTAFKEKYGYDLTPPDTWAQASDQAKFFTKAPDRYGTHFAGKDEGITGRFYEMLVAEGGALLNENWKPTFNSEEGVCAFIPAVSVLG